MPTHVTKWHVQAYFDEFCFKVNRSQFKTSIFHKTINRMVESEPIYQNQKNRCQVYNSKKEYNEVNSNLGEFIKGVWVFKN